MLFITTYRISIVMISSLKYTRAESIIKEVRIQEAYGTRWCDNSTFRNFDVFVKVESLRWWSLAYVRARRSHGEIALNSILYFCNPEVIASSTATVMMSLKLLRIWLMS